MMQKFIVSLLILVLFVSCKQNKRNLPDVSHILIDVHIQRFDNDLFDTKTATAERMAGMQKKYGNLLDYFLSKTFISDKIAMGVPATAVMDEFIKVHKPLYDSTQLLYKDIGWLENELKKGFQYFQFYFPTYKVPKFFAFVDGFYADDPKSYYGVEVGADTVTISLQMFLGKNFSGYDPQFYFDYLRTRFTKEYITKNIFTAIFEQQFEPVAPGSALIDCMVDAGKRVYLLDQCLPGMEDAIKLGFSKRQLEDCYANEQMIWSHFVNANNLFSSEPGIIKEYIGENPFTKAFGTDSPGNIGAFSGWQIVKKFMKNNPKLSVAALMETGNRKIYNETRYKPD